jgi:hypothetical protein
MFLRFIGTSIDERTGQPIGLMSVAYDLLHSAEVNIADESQLLSHLHWIEKEVPIPSRFARRRNAYHKETHGISWVRASATELVKHLYAIADIARRNDVPIEVVRSERPGYLVYEDVWQVVAEPFNDNNA